MDIFGQQLINGLVLGSIYALVALGYTMVYGILELINFAHGEVTMLGAMIGIAFMDAMLTSTTGVPGLAVLAAGLAASIAVCMGIGFRWSVSPTGRCDRRRAWRR